MLLLLKRLGRGMLLSSCTLSGYTLLLIPGDQAGFLLSCLSCLCLLLNFGCFLSRRFFTFRFLCCIFCSPDCPAEFRGSQGSACKLSVIRLLWVSLVQITQVCQALTESRRTGWQTFVVAMLFVCHDAQNTAIALEPCTLY